jgi:hypothetical protein
MRFGKLLNDLRKPKPQRWPRMGDLPFRKAKHPEAAGPLAGDGLTRAVSIMDGFMLAGAALADQALKERFQRYDLVYPMLFCYRHGVETGLKWLIAQYGPAVNVRLDDLNGTHDLWRLWQECLKMYLACGDSANDEALKTVGRIVKQFHDWDKSGMTFRYATAKDGVVVKFQQPDIDIANLKDVMSGVANFFSGSDGWLNSIANA